SHVIRRREVTSITSDEEGFAAGLEHKYRKKLAQQTLMVNELYLSMVYRPTAGVASGLTSQLLKRTQRGSAALEVDDALDACEKLRETLLAALARYEPEVLGLYEKAGRTYSAPLNL